MTLAKALASRHMTGSIDPRSVIHRSVNIYFDRASTLLPMAAVVFGITGVLDAILVAAGPGFVYLSFIVSDIAIALFTGLVVELVADAQGGRRDSSARSLVLTLAPTLPELLLVGLIVGIGIFVGFILIVIPGVILATLWSVAAPVVVLERPGNLRALRRSRELVRGDGLNVFYVILVMVFLVGIVGSGIDLAASSMGTGLGVAVRIIVEIFTAPLSALAAVVLYFDLASPSSTMFTP
jgi:hypothetical protein